MRWLIVLLIAAALSGCTVPEETDPTEPSTSQTETVTQTVTASPTTTGTSMPPTDGCAATVTRSGDRFIARCTVEHTLAPKAGSDVVLRTGNGAIDATDGSGDSTISLWGRGDTEAEARDALARIHLETDATTIIAFADKWQDMGADIDALVGGATLGMLEATTGNGAIDILNLIGKTLEADSGNGAIDITAAFDSIKADTGNGAIDQSGPVKDMELRTGNGAIDANPTALGGTWILNSGNGAMELVVEEGPTFGYDITATSPNGGIDFETTETEPVGQQSERAKHERTTGFESRTVQTTVTMTTGNGNLEISS